MFFESSQITSIRISLWISLPEPLPQLPELPEVHKKSPQKKCKVEPVKSLPRAFAERLKSLDFDMVKKAMGKYLWDK